MKKIYPINNILITIICLIFSIEHTYAQQSKIDSLEKKLQLFNDSNKAIILNELSITYLPINSNKALNFVNEALQISKEKNNKIIEANSYLIKSRIQQLKSNFADAIENIYFALEIYEKKNYIKEIPKCYEELGNVYKILSDYKKATSNYFFAIQNYSFCKDSNGLANCIIKLGHTQIDNFKEDGQQKHFDIAIKYYSSALHFFNISKQYSKISYSYICLANAYLVLNSKYPNNTYLEKSFYYSKKGLQNSLINDNINKVINKMNIANVYEAKKEYDLALIQLDEAYEIVTKIPNLSYSLEILLLKISINSKLGKLDEAKKLLTIYFDVAKKLNDLQSLSYYYQLLSEINFKEKNYKEAYLNRKYLENYKDSIINFKKEQEIYKIEFDYYTKEKNKEIELLNKEKLLREYQLSQDKFLKYTLLSLIGLSILLIATLINRFKIKIKSSKIIEEKNIELEKLSYIARKTDNLVFIANIDGVAEWFNEGFTKFTGWKTIQEYNKGNDKNFYVLLEKYEEIKQKVHQAILEKTSVDYKHLMSHKDGKSFWVKTTFTPIFNEKNEVHKLLFLGTNITEIEKAKETAENALQIQEQFLANTSHEIRTPINGIIGMTTQLFDTPLSFNQKEYLNAIKDSADNLLHVVNDVLDISKIRAGKIDYEKNDFILEKNIKLVYYTLNTKAIEKNIDFTYEINENIPKVLVGDSLRLNQILLNLVGNAVKFTENGFVKINCDIKHQDANKITLKFTVSDSGIGIPKNKIDYIFESFAQAHSNTSRKFGGTGLGLSISKSLIEQQGGNINVESKPNEGTTFNFILDFEIGDQLYYEEKESSFDSNTTIDLSKIMILLVEDNIINQKVATYYLNKWKINSIITDTSEDAIEILKSKKIDLILMDIKLPGMNGIESTKFIRSNLSSPINGIPIIALTANAFNSEREICLQAGMNDYISKPFNGEQLFLKIVKNISAKNFPINDIKTIANTELIDTIDLSTLKSYSTSNINFINEMTELFITNMSIELKKLNDNFNESKWLDLGDQAHKMSSSTELFGLKKTTQLIEIITFSCENNIIDQAIMKQQIEQITNNINNAIIQLKENQKI